MRQAHGPPTRDRFDIAKAVIPVPVGNLSLSLSQALGTVTLESPSTSGTSGFRFIPAQNDVLSTLLEPAAFACWARDQVDGLPEVRRTFDAIAGMVRSDDPPLTVTELFERSRSCAEASVPIDSPLRTGPGAEHNLITVTLLALGGHSIPLDGSVADLFPRFLPDGRPNDAGTDKTQHFFAQAMFAWVTLFDRSFGDGSLARQFEVTVDRSNWDGGAEAILDAHHARPFSAGSMLPGAVADVPSQLEGPSFPQPDDLSYDERRAVRYTELLGAVHEHRTKREFWPGAEAGSLPWEQLGSRRLGQRPQLENPLQRVESAFHVYSGPADAGVRSELEANRLGALMAVALMRDPKAKITVPHDQPMGWGYQPLRPGRPLPGFASYFAEEMSMLARLGFSKGVSSQGRSAVADLDPRREAQRTFAEAKGDAESFEVLQGAISTAVDQLAKSDREALAGYYAGFCVRQLRWGIGDVPTLETFEKRARNELGGPPIYQDHHHFGLTQSAQQVTRAILERVEAARRLTTPRSLDIWRGRAGDLPPLIGPARSDHPRVVDARRTSTQRPRGSRDGSLKLWLADRAKTPCVVGGPAGPRGHRHRGWQPRANVRRAGPGRSRRPSGDRGALRGAGGPVRRGGRVAGCRALSRQLGRVSASGPSTPDRSSDNADAPSGLSAWTTPNALEKGPGEPDPFVPRRGLEPPCLAAPDPESCGVYQRAVMSPFSFSTWYETPVGLLVTGAGRYSIWGLVLTGDVHILRL